MYKNKIKKFIASLLAVVTIVGVMPTEVFSEEELSSQFNYTNLYNWVQREIYFWNSEIMDRFEEEADALFMEAVMEFLITGDGDAFDLALDTAGERASYNIMARYPELNIQERLYALYRVANGVANDFDSYFADYLPEDRTGLIASGRYMIGSISKAFHGSLFSLAGNSTILPFLNIKYQLKNVVLPAVEYARDRQNLVLLEQYEAIQPLIIRALQEIKEVYSSDFFWHSNQQLHWEYFQGIKWYVLDKDFPYEIFASINANALYTIMYNYTFHNHDGYIPFLRYKYTALQVILNDILESGYYDLYVRTYPGGWWLGYNLTVSTDAVLSRIDEILISLTHIENSMHYVEQALVIMLGFVPTWEHYYIVPSLAIQGSSHAYWLALGMSNAGTLMMDERFAFLSMAVRHIELVIETGTPWTEVLDEWWEEWYMQD